MKQSKQKLTILQGPPEVFFLHGVILESLPEHMRKRVEAALLTGSRYPQIVLEGSAIEPWDEEYLRELEGERARKIAHQVKRIEASNAKKVAKADIWREPTLLIAKAHRPPHGNLTTAQLVVKISKAPSMKELVTASEKELATGKKLKRLPSAKTLKNHIKRLEDDGQLNKYDKALGKK